MKIYEEFKKFAIRGNAIDLAVGVVIGAAFGQVVNSLVQDIVSPPIGALLGTVNLDGYYWVMNGANYPSLEAAKAASAPVIAYGRFIQIVINFILTAIAIFVIVKLINLMHKKSDEQKKSAPSTTKQEKLLAEIRDLLKKKA